VDSWEAGGSARRRVHGKESAEFCQRHHIRRIPLFGSILRDDFRPDSDVDFLVEFETGKTPGLLGLAGMEIELSELIGRKVDLRTAKELSRYFREEVLTEAERLYDTV